MILLAKVCRRLRCAFPIIILLASVSGAWACSCRGPGPVELVSQASIIFRGTMLYSYPDLRCEEGSITDCEVHWVGTFSVEEVLKGDLSDRVDVTLTKDPLYCTPPLPKGRSISVAAFDNATFGYQTGFCVFVPVARGGVDPMEEPIAKYRSQLQELDATIASQADKTMSLLGKARFLSDTGSPWAARRVVDQVLQIEPLHRDAVILKALIYSRFFREQDVLTTLAPYLAVHPEDAEAAKLRVISLVRSNLTEDVPQHWRDFSAISSKLPPGVEIDFSGHSLDRASFRNVRMNNITFAKADLNGADFSDAELFRANFSAANLTSASMRNVRFYDTSLNSASLDHADLTDAMLTDADLRGASLRGATLRGVKLFRTLYDDKTIWPLGFDPVAAGAVKED